jgi:hypothetical protein
VPEFTKQLGQFFEDAVAAGFMLKVREPFEESEQLPEPRALVTLSRSGVQDCAHIYLWFGKGKWRFGKAEPMGGAQSLEDFWSMKGLRDRFRIPPNS